MSGRAGSEPTQAAGLLHRLRERGVLRVAASYAVIAWLLLQIADVTLDPLGLPEWVMTALIIATAAGFPLAIALAWFLELGPGGISIDTAAEGVPRPSTRGLRHYADAIVIGVLLIAVVILAVRQSDLGRPKPPENPAIAVLPFENLSGDPEQEYFSDGLADEMLNRLGRVPGLRVIARSSSFGFKGKDIDAKTIAGKLGVTTLLEGSVQRSGQRLKLSARLIDGATGQQLWSGSFDRELQDIFAVQAELASAVVDAIVPTARGSPAENATAPTTDLSAYDLYLASRGQLLIRTLSSIQKSVDLAEQSVRLDPGFARGQAQLANALVFKASFAEGEQLADVAAVRRRAEAAIHSALALDPELSEAHDAYANLLRDTKAPGAEEEYKRALELNANNAAAWHDYAVFLGSQNRQREFLQATARSLELDPRQPTTWANYLGNNVEPGSQRFREEYERAVQMVGDMPAALDRITLPWAAVHGYPVLIMQAALAKQKLASDDNLPWWLNMYRAWAVVDVHHAAKFLAGREETHHGVNYARVYMMLQAEAMGLEGDWAALDRQFAALRARFGENDPNVRSQMAFWLAVQGRFDEAAQSLALAEPLTFEGAIPPLLSSGRDWGFGLDDVARLMILRGTGRVEEARKFAKERLDTLGAERHSAGSRCGWDGWIPYASLLASEDRRSEAVDMLQAAMRCGELPYAFQPQLPWFRKLDGLAPYEELRRERERRIERTRAELLRLEAQADPAPGSRSLQPPGKAG
jgi:adenylate cyclase